MEHAPPRIKPCKKPRKPNPSFPLTAHNNGQWCKKIRGKVYFFGIWADPQAAHQRYLGLATDLHSGRRPRSETISAEGPTVKDACNYYLTQQVHKVESGEIGHRWLEDCRVVLQDFARSVGSTRPVTSLVVEDFARYRQKLSRRGLGGHHGLGAHALTRAITVVRGMFKRAYEDDLIDRPVEYGQSFDKPTATQKRKSRRAIEHSNGKKLLDPAEMLALIKTAQVPLRTMILLGINGGFGNNDCACLPLSSVDWDRNLIEFDRPKTGVERIIPLWPETVQAIKESLENRPSPAAKEYRDLLFLTPSGMPWIRHYVHHTSGEQIQVVNTVVADILGERFTVLLSKLGYKRKGLGFYAVRHTFRTWADEVKDQHAIHRIMGHTIPGMSGIYIEEISLERLRAVTDHVHAKLFANPMAPSPPPSPAAM